VATEIVKGETLKDRTTILKAMLEVAEVAVSYDSRAIFHINSSHTTIRNVKC